MEINDYQTKTSSTAKYQKTIDKGMLKLSYLCLGLTGEAGETANLIKKAMRDHEGYLTPERLEKLKEEMGDTLWYLSELATNLGFTLDDVATYNIEKLAVRYASGEDNRLDKA